ncbi:mRNA export factor rsm1 [Sesbania bispinosa]|nr:mRNA export factor rsm1 [Sesbania bispinosa]
MTPPCAALQLSPRRELNHYPATTAPATVTTESNKLSTRSSIALKSFGTRGGAPTAKGKLGGTMRERDPEP